MIEVSKVLTNHSTCNFCQKTGDYKISFSTASNSTHSVVYCKKHFTEFKSEIILQLLEESE